MSMEINGNYSRIVNSYAKRMEDEQPLDRTDKEKEGKEAQAGMQASDRAGIPHDEYVNSEKAGAKPSGLYRVGQDASGNKKIFFDDPKKAGRADGQKAPSVKPGEPDDSGDVKAGQPRVKSGEPDESEEKCVGNTNQVDKEIRELKAKKKQLEQQIQSAQKDTGKVKELEKELAQVEGELSRKDNDTYRKQHSQFTKL